MINRSRFTSEPIVGQRVTGVSWGPGYRTEWHGIYMGIRPSEHDTMPVHFFEGGAIGTTAQGCHAHPVSQFVTTGTKLVASAADVRMPVARARGEREATKDENARLRAKISELERDLGRARRCIAELRRSKDERIAEYRADAERSACAISTLCRIAFPGDTAR